MDPRSKVTAIYLSTRLFIISWRQGHSIIAHFLLWMPVQREIKMENGKLLLKVLLWWQYPMQVSNVFRDAQFSIFLGSFPPLLPARPVLCMNHRSWWDPGRVLLRNPIDASVQHGGPSWRFWLPSLLPQSSTSCQRSGKADCFEKQWITGAVKEKNSQRECLRAVWEEGWNLQSYAQCMPACVGHSITIDQQIASVSSSLKQNKQSSMLSSPKKAQCSPYLQFPYPVGKRNH